MNSSLDSFVKKLTDNDFKYFPEEFCSDLLKLVKQINMNMWTVLRSFLKISYLIDVSFLVL